jgi:hypothetical protein
MSTYDDDDDLEFDFFDEPETAEATQRRRLPRLERPGGRGGGERPPRPPMRTPSGLVPLARLVGLIAVAIVIVVALVFWVSSCQGRSKHDEYQSYAASVKAIADADTALGRDFANELGSTTKVSELESKLQQYAHQEQQAYTQAQQIRPPGPLRAANQNMLNAIELRYKGLASLANTLASPTAVAAKQQSQTTVQLTQQSELLAASDVVWEQLYREPATERLKAEGVTNVIIPKSQFVSNADTISARAWGVVLTRLSGASTGGTPSGKHGDELVGVRVLPQGSDLSTSSATTVKVSSNLQFLVTVENGGNFQEVGVTVRLTIDFGTGKPIKKTKQIPLIQQGTRQTVTFGGFQLPTSAFGNKATIRVDVAPVPGEVFTANNSASYTVFFTLS